MTKAYRLTCREYNVLQKGDINLFMFREMKHLGALTSIRVSHDNGGDAPDW